MQKEVEPKRGRYTEGVDAKEGARQKKGSRKTGADAKQGAMQTSRELPGERTRLLVPSNPSAPRTIKSFG